jgi:hypothetical protein
MVAAVAADLAHVMYVSTPELRRPLNSVMAWRMSTRRSLTARRRRGAVDFGAADPAEHRAVIVRVARAVVDTARCSSGAPTRP